MSERVLLKVRAPSGVSELHVEELLEVNGRSYIEGEPVPLDIQKLAHRVEIIEATLAALLEPVYEEDGG